MSMTNKEWCQFFIKNKIIQLKEILCSSGVKSPYYCDFRMMLNYNDKMKVLIDLMKSLVEEEWNKLPFESEENTKLNRIGSVPLGAVPFATLLSQSMNKPSIMVRKEAKKYGKKNIIEGQMKVDDNIVMVEDVITTGGSVIEAVKKVENRGGNVKMIICILDRQEGGMEFIKYYYPNLKVVSLFTIGKLMNIAETEKMIEGYDAEKVRFHAEKGFKNMINRIRDLNEQQKLQPYQEDIYKWWSTHYLNSINPLVVGYDYNKDTSNVVKDKNIKDSNSSESNKEVKQNKERIEDKEEKKKKITELTLKGEKLYINNLILDCRCLQEWDIIYFKLKTLGKKVRNIIMDFDTIKEWNKRKQSQLLELQKENRFNVIENTFKISGWNNDLNYDYQLHHIQTDNTEMYPRNLLVNSQVMNVLVSCQEDFTLLYDDIKKSLVNTRLKDNYREVFIHLHFHPKLITKLVSNTDIWKELRNTVLKLNELSGFTLNGVMLDYSVFTDEVISAWKMDKKLELSKCVPIILHTNNQFSLHPSIITNNIDKDEEAMYNKFKKVCLKLGVSQWVVREDILQSNVPIQDKWEMYSKLLGFSNEELECPFRLKGGVSMFVFRDYLEEILNTPLNKINDKDNEIAKQKKEEEEMNNLLSKGRSKLNSMDTLKENCVGNSENNSGDYNKNNTEEDNEPTTKEESPEAKALRLKKEFNEYQIMVDNCLLNIRQAQGRRWKQYDTRQKEKANKKAKEQEKDNENIEDIPRYENGMYSNVTKYGIMRSVGFYWSLLRDKIGY
mgnify:CR=1 FL=1